MLLMHGMTTQDHFIFQVYQLRVKVKALWSVQLKREDWHMFKVDQGARNDLHLKLISIKLKIISFWQELH